MRIAISVDGATPSQLKDLLAAAAVVDAEVTVRNDGPEKFRAATTKFAAADFGVMVDRLSRAILKEDS